MAISETLLFDRREPLLFTSGTFLCLFLVFLLGYAAVTEVRGRAAVRGRPLKLLYLYGFSLFFYYKSSGLFIGLLALTTCADFGLARLIHRSRHAGLRRLWVIASLATSLGILAYLKYANFLLESASALTGANPIRLDVVLPVGISFYTFQSISYVLDVYRGRLAPARSLLDYGLYLAFFPQIVAGPIVRASEMLPQLEAAPTPTPGGVREGLGRALLGLFKKAAIADYLAAYSDVVFSDYSMQSGPEVALGIYAYTLQIYFDFSGYSDLAIGIAQMLGFRLPENFDAPYRALSIADFWRRWHVSLSTWLKDYVYVPLGGNRRGARRRDLNLLLTMLLGGLWHGAAWQFVLWGGLHGVGLLVHKRFVALGWRMPASFAWVLTFHFVAFCWTLFRAPSLEAWWGLLGRLSQLDVENLRVVIEARRDVMLVTAAALAACLVPKALVLRGLRRFSGAPVWARTIAATCVIQAVLQVRSSEIIPFIYFQF